jgi:hypothetical protein
VKRSNFPKRIEQRQAEAKARQEARDKRGDKAQLNKLRRLGYGECKEAKRLEAKIKR